MQFLDDGHVEIDNNIVERTIRSIAVGRRNWLFARSRAGGERAAAIYSITETCKTNDVNPQRYISDVIAKIPGNWQTSRCEELMPLNWKPGAEEQDA